MSYRIRNQHKTFSWSEVTNRLQNLLEFEQMPITNHVQGIEVKSWQQVNASNAAFGYNWEFTGGRRMRYEVQSSNTLGMAGYRGWYQVYALAEHGSIIPNLSAGSTVEALESLVLPMWIDGDIIRAPFHSQFGYYWKVHLRPEKTSYNQGPMFFRVFREV